MDGVIDECASSGLRRRRSSRKNTEEAPAAQPEAGKGRGEITRKLRGFNQKRPQGCPTRSSMAQHGAMESSELRMGGSWG